MRIGSLCAGYGGLDMGVSAVLDAEPVWFCEYAAGPSKILAHHYPNLPNFHDLTTTDWSTVPPVDILTAGWPCQPWSLAGARKGADDERAIWPSIADAIRSLRPSYVALENVSAIVGVGELARAVGDLAALGYDAQWQCVRASDVGAPHRRERCFILASDTDRMARQTVKSFGGGPSALDQSSAVERAVRSNGAPTSPDADHATSNGQRARPEPRQRSFATSNTASQSWGIRNRNNVRTGGGAIRTFPGPRRGTSTDSDGRQRDGWEQDPQRLTVERVATYGGGSIDWGTYTAAIERWERIVGRPAPAPTEPSRNGNGRLSPLLVEWMMGLPEGWVTAVPDLSRNEQLKALGNGVVPQQAAYAFAGLLTLAEAS